MHDLVGGKEVVKNIELSLICVWGVNEFCRCEYVITIKSDVTTIIERSVQLWTFVDRGWHSCKGTSRWSHYSCGKRRGSQFAELHYDTHTFDNSILYIIHMGGLLHPILI